MVELGIGEHVHVLAAAHRRCGAERCRARTGTGSGTSGATRDLLEVAPTEQSTSKRLVHRDAARSPRMRRLVEHRVAGQLADRRLVAREQPGDQVAEGEDSMAG